MRKTIKRGLAVLLCLAMLCSLAATAFAASPEIRTEADGSHGEADMYSSTLPSDGVFDTWTQLEETIVDGSIAPAVEGGKLKLTAVAGNANNCDGATPPAFFTSSEMNEALAAAEGEKMLSFKLTPDSTNEKICLGISLLYTNRRSNMFIGYNSVGGWFAQYYGGTGDWPGIGNGPTLEKGREYAFELKWTDEKITSFTIDGVALDMPNDGGFGNVPPADMVAIKVGKETQSNGITSVTLADIHYTGQKTISAYDVSGTVTDGAAPVVGAAVTLGSKTALTGEDGTYTVTGVAAGTYALTAAAEGYWAPEAMEVTVNGDLEGQDIVLTPYVYNDVTGTVTNQADGKPVEGAVVTAYVDGTAVTAATDENGVYILSHLLAGTYTLAVSAEDFKDGTLEVTVSRTPDTPVNGADVQLEQDALTSAILSTADMDVKVDLSFPRVIQYKMKGELAGKILYGQTEKLTEIELNGQRVTPQVTAEKVSDTQIDYTMTVKDDEKHLDCVVYANITVKDKTLAFNIKNIKNNLDRLDYPVESIYVPNHSLISVRTSQSGANLAGYVYGDSTIASGDRFYDIAGNQLPAVNAGFFNAFLSNDELSAGIASNSDFGTSSAGFNNYRVRASVEARDGYTSVGMGSALWYFDRKVSSSDGAPQQNAPIAREDSVLGPTELPLYVKVSVTGEENGDGQVNWQDGAIYFRDTILHKPYKSEEIPDLVSTRIAMNFGGQAQNPFLTSLDNVKRVALHTDGLGQSILLKGYANEGHDSGHPDYADIGTRMGGPKDMNTLMEEGAKLGAKFGIHVNASEFYPEAKAFSENLVRRNASGGLSYGWNWIDQGIGMNGLYDLASGERDARWDALKALVGDNLDFVYVDVWGNNTCGTEDAWQTRKLSQQLVDHGWRVAHEWAWANEYESTFQHWAADFPYGGFGDKGKNNSDIMRFLLNEYRDSFSGDFPTYGGSCNAPLLGGMAMQGFEGWQGDYEYELAIENIYNQMIPTKFLQHYGIMTFERSESSLALPYPQGASTYYPDVRVTLRGEGHDIEVLRDGDHDGAADESFAYGTAAERLAYRSRTITLDDKVILTGASDPGDFSVNAPAGDMAYLIPWYWDVDGQVVDDEDVKLYHYNLKGGETTWELPMECASWTGAKLYELTDQGRVHGVSVPVENGAVTLTAEAGHYYLLVKAEGGAEAPNFQWSTGVHLKDVSFNGAISDSWDVTGSGTAVIAKTAYNSRMLKLSGGETAVSQTMTDLKAGEQYVVYVGVDNRSDAEAHMTLTLDDGTVIGDNYTTRSIARNYVSAYTHHNGNATEPGGGSCFQNMYLFFTAPESGNVTLTLSRKAGAGSAYFDDVRVTENASENFTYDEQGKLIGFKQNFEHVAQGIWPFVVGPLEGVTDNRIHLSELNKPFTQAGWDVKKMDDVLAGSWSVKVNGLVGYGNLAYQTIPQNFRFEPGVTYTVSFDYQMGSEGIYQVVIGNGAYTGINGLKTIDLKKSLGTTESCTFTVVGDPNGQTWFGIYSTRVGADTQGTSGSVANFGGYKEIVLDNLTIQVSGTNKSDLSEKLSEAKNMAEADYTGPEGAWDELQEAIANAETVMNDLNATQEEVDGALAALVTAMDKLTKLEPTISGTITDEAGKPLAGVTVTLENAASYQPLGLSAVTDSEGKYHMEGLQITAYKLRLHKNGYEVQTLDAVGLTKEQTALTVDAQLTAQTAAPYEITFDDGDVSMLRGLTEADTMASAEAVQHNGSGAMLVTFTGNRNNNNFVVDGVTMKDGVFEFDVTSLNNGARFGADLRANGNMSRTWIGTFDDSSVAGCEWWYNNANYWPNGSRGPGFTVNAARHVKITLAGERITMTVDGVQMFDQNVTGASQESGYFGFDFGHNAGSSTARFIIDNIRLIPADETPDGSYPISGKVLGVDDEALSGAQIVVKNGEGQVVARSASAADGSFVTMALPAGSYTVEVTAPGYSAKTVDAVITDSAATLDAVKLDVDKSQLQALYDANKDRQNENYTDESWQAFREALDHTAAALEGSDPAVIAAAYGELTNAVSGLTEKTVDFGELRALYNGCKNLANTGYTDESWQAFQAALANAKAILEAGTASQAEVDTARDMLQTAFDNLTWPVATYVITATAGAGGTITPAGEIEAQTGDEVVFMIQPDQGYQVKDVIVDGESRGSDIGVFGFSNIHENHTIHAEFEEKIVVQPDKDHLEDLIDEAEELDEDDYTKKSWDALEKALHVAESVLRDPDATESQVRAAELLLEKALDALEKKHSNPDWFVPGYNKPSKPSHSYVPFTDVDTGDWFYDAVDYVYGNDLMNGNAGKFSPYADTTRAMIVTILYRLEGEPSVRYSGLFPDVERGEWYSDAVEWAAKEEIVTGYSNGKFGPMDSITREQLAAILYRYADYRSWEVDASADLNEFEDGNVISDYAVEAMEWAVDNGLITGLSNGTLAPQAKANRAQVATILMRFCEEVAA